LSHGRGRPSHPHGGRESGEISFRGEKDRRGAGGWKWECWSRPGGQEVPSRVAFPRRSPGGPSESPLGLSSAMGPTKEVPGGSDQPEVAVP